MSTSTGSSDDHAAEALGVAEHPGDTVEFWCSVAEKAIPYFANDKAAFMSWVNGRYGDDKHRMAASCCWDIVRLGQES